MSRLVVLVNGLPGSGKTTLARPLAVALRLPLLGKDALKETMATILGSAPPDGRSQRAWSQALGAAAMEMIWTLLADTPDGAMVESNLMEPTRPFVVAGLARAGVVLAESIEVWCDVPAALARRRFEERAKLRHPIHGRHLALDAEWAQWSLDAAPLGLGRVIRVDTARPVDVATLASSIRVPTSHHESIMS